MKAGLQAPPEPRRSNDDQRAICQANGPVRPLYRVVNHFQRAFAVNGGIKWPRHPGDRSISPAPSLATASPRSSGGSRGCRRSTSAPMEAIRAVAAEHGMAALGRAGRYRAQLALMPGHRVATRACLEHMDEALDSTPPTTAERSSPRSPSASTRHVRTPQRLSRIVAARCALSPNCSTTSSTRGRATPSSS